MDLSFYRLKTLALFFFSLLFVSACEAFKPKSASLLGEVYIPPSPMAAGLPTMASLGEIALVTPTVSCVNSLLFITDQTIPDGTEVERGAILDKIWEVENNGTCNWDERYRLKLIGGSELGAKAEQALFPARNGTRFLIHIRFNAPQEAGNVRSAWQAFDPDGNPFGDPIYLEIVVK